MKRLVPLLLLLMGAVGCTADSADSDGVASQAESPARDGAATDDASRGDDPGPVERGDGAPASAGPAAANPSEELPTLSGNEDPGPPRAQGQTRDGIKWQMQAFRKGDSICENWTLEMPPRSSGLPGGESGATACGRQLPVDSIEMFINTDFHIVGGPVDPRAAVVRIRGTDGSVVEAIPSAPDSDFGRAWYTESFPYAHRLRDVAAFDAAGVELGRAAAREPGRDPGH